ncbi:hypothetical protein D3C73_1208410 [compost metagenome]
MSEQDNNIIRKRLVNAIYNNLSDKKGDAMWETTSNVNYEGRYTDNNPGFPWLIDTVRKLSESHQYINGWNKDYALIRYSDFGCYIERGGSYNYGSLAGLFAFSSYTGGIGGTFRPVLVTGNSL